MASSSKKRPLSPPQFAGALGTAGRASGAWTTEERVYLWLNQDYSRDEVASRLHRTTGACNSELKHMRTPGHQSYNVRMGSPALFKPQPATPATMAAPGAPRSPGAAIELSPEQKRAVELVNTGKSIFVTGGAGVGKSVSLRAIVTTLKEEHGDDVVAVGAPTGIAAMNVDGVTVHAIAGLPPKIFPERASDKADERFKVMKALVLDEVSMLSIEMFEWLDNHMREARGDASPFGGVQLVLFGDFFQLPPVGQAALIFESAAWRALSPMVVNLNVVFRQSNAVHVDMLNDVRVAGREGGHLSLATMCTLRSLAPPQKQVPEIDDDIPRLYTENKDVERLNQTKLAMLPGMTVACRVVDVDKAAGDNHQRFAEELEKRMPSNLTYKIGARIVMTKNWAERELMNGSMGTVTGTVTDFVDAKSPRSQGVKPGDYEMPIVKFDSLEGEVRVEPVMMEEGAQGEGSVQRSGIPVKCARHALRASACPATPAALRPLHLASHEARTLCSARRLAWAITIHKSQGMTLQRAIVKFEGAPFDGQVYVALSRVASLDGTYIDGRINEHDIRASTKVKQFYGYTAEAEAAAAARLIQRRIADAESDSYFIPDDVLARMPM